MTRNELMYVVGMLLSVMIFGGIGGALARDHGARRVYPVVSVVALAGGFAIGWAINTWLDFAAASYYH